MWTSDSPPRLGTRYSQPGLQAHISYLYGLTTQADQKVGRDAVERYAALRAALDRQLAAMEKVLGTGPRAAR